MITTIQFPKFSGLRCLMMPYRQGDPSSIPDEYAAYYDIIDQVFLNKGDIGFLTIDESFVAAGTPHRGARARHGRALHTEAGLVIGVPRWGGGNWGGRRAVTLDRNVRILISSNMNASCAVWDADHLDTTEDGDIGHLASMYPYNTATQLQAGEVREIGIFTPHESLPAAEDFKRQFLRIVSSGVHGREPYFTENHKIQSW